MDNEAMELPTWMIYMAFRYCLGRKTYAVNMFCDWAVRNWEKLPQGEQCLIKSELDQAFTLDAMNQGMSYLGMDCDKRDWERVRAAYQKKEVTNS